MKTFTTVLSNQVSEVAFNQEYVRVNFSARVSSERVLANMENKMEAKIYSIANTITRLTAFDDCKTNTGKRANEDGIDDKGILKMNVTDFEKAELLKEKVLAPVVENFKGFITKVEAL